MHGKIRENIVAFFFVLENVLECNYVGIEFVRFMLRKSYDGNMDLCIRLPTLDSFSLYF